MPLIRFLTLTCFCIVLNGPVLAAAPATLRYNVDHLGGWIPFDASINPKQPSVFLSIIALLETKTNITVNTTHFPAKRSVKELNLGNIDFDFVNRQWLTEKEQASFVFSHALFDVTEYYISLPSNIHNYPSREQIYGSLVGTVAGYFYFDDQKFIRADFRTESEVILGLAKGRFNIAIMEKYAAEYWSYKHQVPIAYGPIHTQGQVVIRLREALKHLLPQLDKAIDELNNQHKISAIVEQRITQLTQH